MNYRQKEKVGQLRDTGAGYARIARLLQLPESTVKSYCRRNGLDRNSTNITKRKEKKPTRCAYCRKPLVHIPGYRAKKYCSSKCRMAWWNAHPSAPNRKSARAFTCLTCGQSFVSGGKRERKYCSFSCYNKSRAGQL